MKKKMNVFPIFVMISILIFAFSCKSGGEQKEGAAEEVKEEKIAEMAEPNTLTPAEKAEGWRLLFDGEAPVKHFKGYNNEKFPEQGWKVEDGTIRCIGSGKGEAGGKGGDIITREKFKWFELKLQWKISKGGNSGIFYLSQEIPGEPVWKSSPEMQVLDNENHPNGQEPLHSAGALYDLIPPEPIDAAKPYGEWNQVKLLVYKGTVQHWLNGQKVVEYHLWTKDWKDMVENSKFAEYPWFVEPAEEGHVGLQDHGDDVWYRGIKIKELE